MTWSERLESRSIGGLLMSNVITNEEPTRMT